MIKKNIFYILFLIILGNICWAQTPNKNFPKAIDSLQILLKQTKTPSKRVDILNKLAEKYKTLHPSQTFTYAQEAYQMAQSIDYQQGMATALNNIGEFYLDDGNYKQALTYFSQSLVLAKKLNSLSLEAIALNKIGVAYYFQNMYTQALEYELKTLKIQEKLQDYREMGNILSMLSYIYTKKGNYREALDYHFKALEVREKLGDKNEIAKSYNSIGDFYLQQNHYSEALKSYTNALETSEANNNKKGIAISTHNMGVVYERMGKLSMAENYLFQSLHLKKELEIKKEIALSLNSIGVLNLKKQDFAKALDFLTQAYTINQELANKEMMIINLNNLGQIFNKQKNYSKGNEYHQKALHLAKELKEIPLLGETYKCLFNNYLAMDDASNFLQYYRLYNELDKNQLSENLNSIEIRSIELRYEYTKKQKEIELLKKENTIKKLEIRQKNLIGSFLIAILFFLLGGIALIYQQYRQKRQNNISLRTTNQSINLLNEKLSQSEKELESLNAVKDKFLSILSHDLRTPLNTILALVEVLEEPDSLKPTEFQEIMHSLKFSTRNTLGLLDNILHWSKTQADGIQAHPSEIVLTDIIQEILELIAPTAKFKNIHISQVLDNQEKMILADKNMLKTVLLNLVANALKFTPEGGEIWLKTQANKDFMNISVEDNGVGIKAENLEKLFSFAQVSQVGTTGEKGIGLGLVLCKEFVELNGGKIWVESELDKGSTFKFTIPYVK